MYLYILDSHGTFNDNQKKNVSILEIFEENSNRAEQILRKHTIPMMRNNVPGRE